MKYFLLITKFEYTLEGINLTSKQRSALCLYRDPEVVEYKTTLYLVAFKTAKAAWEAATPELLDQLGLVWDASQGTYSTDYADYDVNVVRRDRLYA